jgi:hypothetical protein
MSLRVGAGVESRRVVIYKWGTVKLNPTTLWLRKVEKTEFVEY